MIQILIALAFSCFLGLLVGATILGCGDSQSTNVYQIDDGPVNIAVDSDGNDQTADDSSGGQGDELDQQCKAQCNQNSFDGITDEECYQQCVGGLGTIE